MGNSSSVNEEKDLGATVVDRETVQGFTPGPWSLTNEGTYIRPDCLKGTLRRYLPGETPEPQPPIPSWPAICRVEPWPQDRWDCLGEEESRANARLIAAAPALYEALKATSCRYSRIRECVGPEMCDRCAALALVRLPDPPEVKD